MNLVGGGKLKIKVMSETNSPNAHFSKVPSGHSKLGKEVRRTSSKGGLKS